MFLPIPRTTGFNSSLQNVGSMENQGFEFNPFFQEYRWRIHLEYLPLTSP